MGGCARQKRDAPGSLRRDRGRHQKGGMYLRKFGLGRSVSSRMDKPGAGRLHVIAERPF